MWQQVGGFITISHVYKVSIISHFSKFLVVSSPFPISAGFNSPRKHDFMDWGWVKTTDATPLLEGMKIFLNDCLSYAEMSKPANFLGRL